MSAKPSADPFGFFQRLCKTPPNDLMSRQFADLHRLVQLRAEQDPAGFAQGVLKLGTGLLATLALRLQYYAFQDLERGDDPLHNNLDSFLRPDIHRDILPHLMKLYTAFAELSAVQAGIARQWELTRAKRLENSELTRERRKKKSKSTPVPAAAAAQPAIGPPSTAALPQTAPTPPVQPATNGHAANVLSLAGSTAPSNGHSALVLATAGSTPSTPGQNGHANRVNGFAPDWDDDDDMYQKD